MSKTFWSLAAALVLMSGTASAQTARAVVQAASKNMGADNLKCITYSGLSGYVGIVGQAHDIHDFAEKVEISNYTRTINYDAKSFIRGPHNPTGQSPARWRRRHPAPGRTAAAELRPRQSRLEHAGRDCESAAGRGGRAADRHLDEPAWLHQRRHGAGRQSGAPYTRYENGAVGTLAGLRYRKLNIISFTFGKFRSTAPSTTRTSSNGSRRALPIRSAAT